MSLVADVDDAIPLAGAHLDLVVHLRDQGAHGIDHVAPVGACGIDDLGGRTMGREHDGAAGGDISDVVDEHDAEVLEALHDALVVHDLVVAVHGRLEGSHHPRQSLDGHLDSGAEAPGSGEEYAIDL